MSIQNPILLDRYSEPQPDVALLRPRDDFYESGHPQPDDILLVIEVADTTLEYDRDVKLPRYAARGIREAWVIDVDSGVILVYRQPGGEGYQQSQTVGRGEMLAPSALPVLLLPAEQLLG